MSRKTVYGLFEKLKQFDQFGTPNNIWEVNAITTQRVKFYTCISGMLVIGTQFVIMIQTPLCDRVIENPAKNKPSMCLFLLRGVYPNWAMKSPWIEVHALLILLTAFLLVCQATIIIQCFCIMIEYVIMHMDHLLRLLSEWYIPEMDVEKGKLLRKCIMYHIYIAR